MDKDTCALCAENQRTQAGHETTRTYFCVILLPLVDVKSVLERVPIIRHDYMYMYLLRSVLSLRSDEALHVLLSYPQLDT